MGAEWPDDDEEDDMDMTTYRRHTSALARAGGNPAAVLRAARAARASFEAEGWPDDWTRWTRALEDALFPIVFGGGDGALEQALRTELDAWWA